MAGELGAEIDLCGCLDIQRLPADIALFSESNGRFVVSVAVEDSEQFEARFEGLACRPVGRVIGEPVLQILLKEESEILSVPVAALKASYKETLSHV
jgi:phosphoribosylformylglycinamidine synthase